MFRFTFQIRDVLWLTVVVGMASYRKPEPEPPTWREFLGTLPDE